MDRREALKRSILFSGYALSASTIGAVLQGCTADSATAEADWAPRFLSNEDYTMLGEIAETILPRTEGTPGAKDVYVHRFIDNMMADYVEKKDQEAFGKGLEALKADCQKNTGKAFVDLSAEAQLAYLNELNMQALKGGGQDEGPGLGTAFLMLKQGIIMGYFTSEKVGEEVLAYDPIPGAYDPCASLEEITQGKNWSL